MIILYIHQPFLSSIIDLSSSHVFRKPSYYLRMAMEISMFLQMLLKCEYAKFEPYSSMVFLKYDVVKVNDLSSSLFLNSRTVGEYGAR